MLCEGCGVVSEGRWQQEGDEWGEGKGVKKMRGLFDPFNSAESWIKKNGGKNDCQEQELGEALFLNAISPWRKCIRDFYSFFWM